MQKYPNMDAGQTPSFAVGDNYWIHIQAEGLVEKYPGKLDSLLSTDFLESSTLMPALTLRFHLLTPYCPTSLTRT